MFSVSLAHVGDPTRVLYCAAPAHVLISTGYAFTVRPPPVACVRRPQGLGDDGSAQKGICYQTCRPEFGPGTPIVEGKNYSQKSSDLHMHTDFQCFL